MGGVSSSCPRLEVAWPRQVSKMKLELILLNLDVMLKSMMLSSNKSMKCPVSTHFVRLSELEFKSIDDSVGAATIEEEKITSL